MKVLAYSGSRADYGGLEAVVSALRARDINVILSSHREYASDTDMAVLLGDRNEVLSAATDIFLSKIPIAHLSGGDITEGSQDDCMRHAITKLSNFHFVTNKSSFDRVIQLGEEPWRVMNVGYPGVDNLDLIDLKEAKRQAGIENFSDNFVIVLWHPNTLMNAECSTSELMTVAMGIGHLSDDMLLIGPNYDDGHVGIRTQHAIFKHERDRYSSHLTHYVEGLDRSVYLTLLANCRVLIGNSSSGYYEAPSFGTPVVDIGNRQKGREISRNIINCGIDRWEIFEAINTALVMPRVKTDNPYRHYAGKSAETIADSIIARVNSGEHQLPKKFYDYRTQGEVKSIAKLVRERVPGAETLGSIIEYTVETTLEVTDYVRRGEIPPNNRACYAEEDGLM